MKQFVALLFSVVSVVLKLCLVTPTYIGDSASFVSIFLLFELVFWLVLNCRRHKSLNKVIVAVIFPFISFVYLNTPLFMFPLDILPYNFSNNSIVYSLQLLTVSSTICFLAFFFLFSQSLVGVLFRKIKNELKLFQVTKIGIWLFIIIGTGVALLYLYNFYSSGAYLYAGNASRLEVINAAETGKTWLLQYIFSAWVIVAFLCFTSNTGKFTRIHMAFVLLIIIAFLVPYVQLGNRRELASIILFLLVLQCVKGNAVKALLPLGILIPVVLVVGYFRQSTSELILSDFLVSVFGEFLFPHTTLIYGIEFGSPMYLGTSIYTGFIYFLPSLGLWDKGLSLAQQFSLDYGGGMMGYGYTPYAEMFVNFGASAVVLFPFIIASLIYVLIRIRSSNWLPIFILCFSLDINRGEFASIFMQLLIYVILATVLIRTLNVGRDEKFSSSSYQ
ncbi:O-antigen polymerase [Catenovulum sediminis]|uniref:O-antigen polymerase n=1 Tax=Catenovulum sediminis TaxID=1740262 RepID=A0ABV1RJW5_9ALTE